MNIQIALNTVDEVAIQQMSQAVDMNRFEMIKAIKSNPKMGELFIETRNKLINSL